MAKASKHDNATKQNAEYLSEISGIPTKVCMAWLRAEPQLVSNPTNPLNIVRQPKNEMQVGASGMYATYNTAEDGLRDAVAIIQHPNYELLNLAIRSGDPLRIAKAIELSPWNNQHYGANYPTKDGQIVKNYLRMTRASTTNRKNAVAREPSLPVIKTSVVPGNA